MASADVMAITKWSICRKSVVARYLSQLDTADRQEPSEALAIKTDRLKEKLAKLEEEMEKLAAIEKQMLAGQSAWSWRAADATRSRRRGHRMKQMLALRYSEDNAVVWRKGTMFKRIMLCTPQ
jgi:hypothetical protein